MNISNDDDRIDAEDVKNRIEELEEELTSMHDEHMEEHPAETLVDFEPWLKYQSETMGNDDAIELLILRDFASEIGDRAIRNGEQLIRESDFENYARDLADDIGAIKSEAGWPTNCIDWKQAASELRMDYTGADYGGVTYYFRD